MCHHVYAKKLYKFYETLVHTYILTYIYYWYFFNLMLVSNLGCNLMQILLLTLKRKRCSFLCEDSRCWEIECESCCVGQLRSLTWSSSQMCSELWKKSKHSSQVAYSWVHRQFLPLIVSPSCNFKTLLWFRAKYSLLRN